MYYQLSRLGVCVVKTKGRFNQLSGSSNLICDGDFIAEKEKRKSENSMITNTLNSLEKKEKKPKTKLYRLKKTKIRNKILNFFALNRSKKFCAFYSISFPKSTSDEICYQVFNTWLTRCRKSENLKSYLWVAERQKNNTLHFHLITNDFMPIRRVNDYMRESLRTQWIKGNLEVKEKIIDKYNGVDVDNLYYSKRNKNKGKRLSRIESQRKLSYYLTKYISKNNTLSNRLPWHCSRCISALFTKINYNDVADLEIFSLVNDNPEAVTTYSTDFFDMHYFKFLPADKFFKDLTEANNLIYETLNPN